VLAGPTIPQVVPAATGLASADHPGLCPSQGGSLQQRGAVAPCRSACPCYRRRVGQSRGRRSQRSFGPVGFTASAVPAAGPGLLEGQAGPTSLRIG